MVQLMRPAPADASALMAALRTIKFLGCSDTSSYQCVCKALRLAVCEQRGELPLMAGFSGKQ